MHPAVARVRAALDQPGRLQPVDHAAHAHALDLDDVGQAGLVDALAAGQEDQHAPLRAGQAEMARAGIEMGPHQARNVVQQEAEQLVEGGLNHNPRYRCRAYNKQAYNIQAYKAANRETPFP